jgi:predicted dienelactone hydrolase
VWELPGGVAAGLAGRLDMGAVAAVGHSYGGATVAAAAASLPSLRAAVSLDPWW